MAMQKTSLFGIATVAIVAIAAPSLAQQSTQITAKNNAPLKAGADARARVVATVPRGSTLTLQYCTANGWCSVRFRGQAGWMATVNLNLPADHGDRNDGTIRSQAKMRAGPGTQYQVVRTLYAGARVDVITCQSQWCHVNDGNRRGWVWRSLIDLRGDWGSPKPPPGRGSELTMFTERNCRGNSYATSQSVPNLNYLVRSARVTGGTGNASADSWQLCVGTNYNGVCTSTKVNSACSNLDELNGQGRLRSVRRYSEGMGGTPQPGKCTTEYAPVCARAGSRSQTFGNACEARAANYSVQYQGRCR
jgi:uncharacterized protein YraI